MSRTRRLDLRLVVLALLALAGTFVLVRSWMLIEASGRALGGPVPGLGVETIQACQVDSAIVHHSGGYASFAFNAYPLPYELVLTPLCVLPEAAWQVLAVALTLALALVALRLWTDDGISAAFWLAVLSPVLVEMVQVDQIFTAIGLFGISLAVWAQRRERWIWLGVAAAIALIRPINAAPVLLMLALQSRPRDLLKSVAAAVAVAVAPAAVSWVLDPAWVQHYLHLLATYRIAGIPQLVARAWGGTGLLVLSTLAAVVGGLLAGRPGPRPANLDRAALALALSVVATPLQGLYVGAMALPGIVRLASRRDGGWIAWIAVGASWAGILLASGLLLGPNPAAAYPFLSVIGYWLVLNAYPLARTRARAPASPPGPLVDQVPRVH